MKAFIEVEGLAELEQSGKWGEAKDLVYNLWNRDKKDEYKLCRLIFECWYVLCEWDSCISKEALSYDNFKETLIEAVRYGFEHFNTNSVFLWVCGYMISLFPYLFYKGDDDKLYKEWEQQGKDMLLSAKNSDSENLIAKVFYLGTQKDCGE